MSEDQPAGGQDLPRKERQGLPEATPRGNRMRPLKPGFHGMTATPQKVTEKQ